MGGGRRCDGGRDGYGCGVSTSISFLDGRFFLSLILGMHFKIGSIVRCFGIYSLASRSMAFSFARFAFLWSQEEIGDRRAGGCKSRRTGLSVFHRVNRYPDWRLFVRRILA